MAEAGEQMRRRQREFVERKGLGFPEEYRERARPDLNSALSLLSPDDLQTTRTCADEYVDVWSAVTPVDDDLPWPDPEGAREASSCQEVDRRTEAIPPKEAPAP